MYATQVCVSDVDIVHPTCVCVCERERCRHSASNSITHTIMIYTAQLLTSHEISKAGLTAEDFFTCACTESHLQAVFKD